MATTDTTENSLRVWRTKMFDEMGFELLDSLTLADAKGLDGFALSHHDVKKYLAGGATKEQIVVIFGP
jgi:hypothetical protein